MGTLRSAFHSPRSPPPDPGLLSREPGNKTTSLLVLEGRQDLGCAIAAGDGREAEGNERDAQLGTAVGGQPSAGRHVGDTSPERLTLERFEFYHSRLHSPRRPGPWDSPYFGPMPDFRRGPAPLPSAGGGFSLPSLGSLGSVVFCPYSRVGAPVGPSLVVLIR